VSCIGYATLYKPYDGGNDAGVLQLASDAQMLGEVVVKGDLPQTRLKGNALLTTVSGTLLEKAGTAEDLLDKLPGVSAKGGVSVFGRGSAEVYINGRKVRNNSELDQLASDNIKSVEVIRNPGARYDASVKAVVRIVTKRLQGDGFGFNNRTVASYRTGWSGAEQFDFNYRTGGFDLSGMLFGSDGRSRTDSRLGQNTYLDKHWHQELKSHSKSHYQSVSMSLSMNYMFSPEHSVGGKYEFDRTPMHHLDNRLDMLLYKDGELEEEVNSIMAGSYPDYSHGLNVYYSGQVKKWSIDVNLDGLWGNSKQQSLVREIIQPSADERMVQDCAGADNRLYAAKLVLSRSLGGGELSLGGEYADARRTNDYRSLMGTIDDSRNKIEEQSAGGFVEYARRFGRVYAQMGVRYEHVAFDYYEDNILKEEQSKVYDQLFPSVSLSYKSGEVQLGLTYKEDISRPSYHMLRGNIQYNNRYLYETGNPLLEPSKSHNVELAATYKWLVLSLAYRHTLDAVISDSYSYKGDHTIAVMNLKNGSSFDNFMAYVHARKKIGRWTPSAVLAFSKQWYKTETFEGMKDMDKPAWRVQAGSDLDLPGGFLLSARFDWVGCSDRLNSSTLDNSWTIQLSLYKSFLKERLSLQLNANDIFNTNHQSVFSYVGGLRTISKITEPNSRSVRLTVRYKFNAAKNKYKGTGAGTSQKSRM